jgi:hypothetical protein
VSKSYCGNCRHFIKHTPHDPEDLEWEYCNSPENYGPNYITQTGKRLMNPADRNEFNNCKLFAPKRSFIHWLLELMEKDDE